MARGKIILLASLSLSLLLFASSGALAQIEVGDFTIRGQAEIGGMPRHMNGERAKFEEYRDIPESVIVPQIEFFIDTKKQDYYLEFDSSKLGRNDQNYRLRFGRYGLLDVELEWDQIPHLFNVDTARTPYARSNNGGTLTLSSRPTFPITLGSNPATNEVNLWLDRTAQPVDLSLYNGIGRFKLRYTPTPGWTFTGNYWSNNNSGKRSFGSLFGTNPGNYNITELVEPINYNSHNIELGGEYARPGWSIGLKYNASLFHNNVSTLVWDNPIRSEVAPGVCQDSVAWSGTGATGPCRGRLDLYPSNQAHTFTLSGAAALPLKTHFMGTVSYGWRLQDDHFLPGTINSAIAQPGISKRSLNGDVRPLMVNATLVNNSIERLNLKAFYRFYDLGNQSNKVTLTDGWIRLDAGAPQNVGERLSLHSYSKHDIGYEAGYDITRWLKAKFAYGYERIHRADLDVSNSNEVTIGPTFDIKPSSWMLLRASYKHSWRDAPGYHQTAKRFFEAKRDRDKVSLFSEITPWETLSLHGGFEFTGETYPGTNVGTQNDVNYSPSIGLIYAPAQWIKLFADYNWDRFDWSMDARATVATPTTNWTSRGRDKINTVSLGSDIDLIPNLLGIRLQYGFSDALSKVHASGNPGANAATNYPSIINRWHEFLARLEYNFHKNFALDLGYYYNGYKSKDYGVDIMKVWMGDVDTSAGVTRSVFLGDQLKGSYMAHVGFAGLKIKF